MGWKITDQLENLESVLSTYRLTQNDLAVLRAIGGRENDVARGKVEGGEAAEFSKDGLLAWCRASQKRIGLDKSLSLSTVERSLKALSNRGFIDERARRGRKSAFYRRVNQTMLAEMLSTVPARKVEIDGIMRADSDDEDSDTFQVEPLIGDEAIAIPVVAAPVVPNTARIQKPPTVVGSAGSAHIDVPRTPDSSADPSEQLAILLFNYSGRRGHLSTHAHLTATAEQLDGLRRVHGFERVRDVMTWAFTVDTFWPPILLGQSDTCKYFIEKFEEKLLPKFQRWESTQTQLSQPKQPQQPHQEGTTNAVYSPRSNSSDRTTGNAAALAEAKRRNAVRLGLAV